VNEGHYIWLLSVPFPLDYKKSSGYVLKQEKSQFFGIMKYYCSGKTFINHEKEITTDNMYINENIKFRKISSYKDQLFIIKWEWNRQKPNVMAFVHERQAIHSDY
jgi:hypothetical protein